MGYHGKRFNFNTLCITISVFRRAPRKFFFLQRRADHRLPAAAGIAPMTRIKSVKSVVLLVVGGV